MTAQETLAETHTDGFLVMKHGAVVAEHYVNQQPDDRHIVFSVSKSITATLAGILVEQGLLDPAAPVIRYVPEAKGSAYEDCNAAPRAGHDGEHPLHRRLPRPPGRRRALPHRHGLEPAGRRP